MYKISGFVAICLLSATASFGQVRFGVQGSGQLSNITVSIPQGQGSFNSSDYFKPKFGFRAGVMADIPVSDQFSVRPQLLYSVKGTKIDLSSLVTGIPNVDPNQLKANLNYNYLELPVQAVYKLEAGPGQVAIGAGPYVAYLMSANSVSGGQTEKADLTDTKRVDYGVNALVGYELPAGLTISAYYSYGLSNLGEASVTGTPSTGSTANTGTAHHRDFGVTIGYFFGSNR